MRFPYGTCHSDVIEVWGVRTLIRIYHIRMIVPIRAR
eukprot:SAG31_NODE_20359_length_576_cov_9.670860_2_plen_37_part_01